MVTLFCPTTWFIPYKPTAYASQNVSQFVLTSVGIPSGASKGNAVA